MHAELPRLLPLVCPACRERSDRGWEMHTLSLAECLRAEAGRPDEVLEGTLACENAACGRRYPVIDGIPVVVTDLAGLLEGELALIVEGELCPETAGLLAAALPDDRPWARALEHLSIYLDAHWGDRASPAADGPGPRFGFAALAERLRARAPARVPRAVELGCGVGRGLWELAAGADEVVGVDLHFGALRRARRLLGGREVTFARRVVGRRYRPASLAAPGPLPGGARLALVCGDALDPPLVPGAFERVVALNLLDAVRRPADLLQVVDGLVAPGGEAILGCPYAWQSGIVDEDARLGGDDPAADVARRLRTGDGLGAAYTIEEAQDDVAWSLRRDARSAHTFSVHYMRARKPALAPTPAPARSA